MTIELPDDLSRYLLGEVERGRFASEAEAIAEAVRLFRQNGSPPPPTEPGPAPRPTDGAGSMPAWERMIDLMKDLPDSAFDAIPTDLPELHDHPSPPQRDGGGPPTIPDRRPGWQIVLDAMADVPDSAFDLISSDGSEQHDHYIYGTPKRPNS